MQNLSRILQKKFDFCAKVAYNLHVMRERQQKIVEYIQKVGIVSIDELAQRYEVSPFTIRRDIDYLSQSRLLMRIKGGAQRIETPRQFQETRLPHRMQVNLAQKEKIAAKALEFIKPGDSIFLDGSSTITCLARAIAQAGPDVAGGHDITVVTNSVLISLELAETANKNIRLIGLGGVFDPETFSFVGFGGDAYTDAFYIDKAFFSCTGFIPGEGTYENAAFNRNTKRLIAQRAEKVYMLVDSSKIGQRALNRVLSIEQIDVLITESTLLPQHQEILSRQNVDTVIS
jgi:DeoR/GlpR family transcriptional regulator of sugar metabolism